MAEAGQHPRRRTLDGLAADDGADGDAARAAGGHGLAQAGDGEDGADAEEGVAGREDEPLRVADGIGHAGGGNGLLRARETQARDLGRGGEAHHVVLEGELAVRRAHDGGDACVGGGQDGRVHAEGARQFGHDGVHGAALAQQARAVHGGGEVAVAEVEPAVVAEAAQGVRHGEGVAREPPAGFGVDHAREGVDDDVDVGGNVQAEHLHVVAHVGDDGHGGGIGDAHEALQEAGGADAPGEHGEGGGHGPLGRAACFPKA